MAKDAEDQIEAAMGAAHALKAVHGTSFTVSLVDLFLLSFLAITANADARISESKTGSLCELLYRYVSPLMFFLVSHRSRIATGLQETWSTGCTPAPGSSTRMLRTYGIPGQ